MSEGIATRDEKEMIFLIEPFKGFEIVTHSDEQRGEAARYLDQEIDDNMKTGLLAQLNAGWYLHVMKESGAWKGIGEHVKSWKDYVEKEKGISTGTDSFLRGAATTLGPVLLKEGNEELLSIDYKRLTEVLTLFRRNKALLDKYVAEHKKDVLAIARPDSERQEADGSPVEDFEIDLDRDTSAETEEATVREPGQGIGEVLEAQEVEEDAVKEYVLRNAKALPLKSWYSFVNEIRGEEATDLCVHDGEVDILHRCRQCGQVFSPLEGHSEHFKELDGVGDEGLLKELQKAYGAISPKAEAALECWYEKKGKKFFVRRPGKTEAGVYYTDMKAHEYSREGFINLVIEIKKGGEKGSNAKV